MAGDKATPTVQYLNTLAHGIANIWQDGLFMDIQICVEKRIFRCHKIVLSSLSAYFNAMFQSGMRESSEGTIHIQEVDSNVFEVLLTYLYTGKVTNMNDCVSDLLEMAVMFQVKCLQEQCEMYLEKELGG